jgi:hypothetical protein
MTQPDHTQPEASGPTARLVLFVRAKDGVFGFTDAVEPYAQLGDRQGPLSWGRNDVDVAAGRVRLSTWVRRGRSSFGAAHSEVVLAPGQQVELHYSPPMFNTMRGRIGSTPQPFPGKIALVVLLVMLLGLAVTAVTILLVSLFS